MADTTTTPNMNLVLPNVSECPGPAWATDNNAAFSAVDSHNHSSGQGVPITPAGLNISTDLTMAGNNLTNARSVRFMPQGSPLAGAADLGCIYESGVDLYYNDGEGNQVRITQGGNVTGSTGTITGLPSGTASASFAAGTFTWQAATNTPATMNSGPLVVGAAGVVNSKTVTLTPTNTLAANYVLTFPAGLPGTVSLATIDAAGNIATTTAPTLSGGTLNGTYGGNPTFSGDPVFSGSVTFSGSVAISSGTAAFSAGSAAAPSITFAVDPDTGIYSEGANQIGFATGGVRRAALSNNAMYFSDGTVALPSLSFLNDSNTGIYSSAADQVAFSTGGVNVAKFLGSGGRVISGSAALPSWSFLADIDTGLYNSSAGALNVTCNGTNSLQVSTDGLASGTITAASSIKWKVFTGTLASGGTADLACPGTTILSISGWVVTGGTAGNVIFQSGSISGAQLWIDPNFSTNTSVRLQNAAGSSRVYHATMFYQ